MKLYPLIVTVNGFPPCVAEFGFREVIAGTGFDGGGGGPPPVPPPDPDPLPHPAMSIENVRPVTARTFGTNLAVRTAPPGGKRGSGLTSPNSKSPQDGHVNLVSQQNPQTCQ